MPKGTIVLVPFPFTDLSGHKVRPCLILYEQKNGDDCIVAFISSMKRTRLGKFEIGIKAVQGNGLKVDSVIRMDKLATLQKKIILGELGSLDAGSKKAVDRALKGIFGLK